MQATYYERLLADEQVNLGSILDSDIARLTASGSLRPAVEDPTFIDCRSRYIQSAMHRVKQVIAATMSEDQFERYQQTPSFHEVLVQKATQQYWMYEAFLFLRAHGARTVNVGEQACTELMRTPLEAYGRDFKLEVPAQMLVFESAELVDAFYAGERRSGAGRLHVDAAICVLVLEMRAGPASEARYLKLLSVHGDAQHEYRVEIRKLLLGDARSLEDILEDEDSNGWHGAEQVEQLIGLPTRTVAWASRKADCGFYAAKTPYYRAVLGALYCARTEPRRLAWCPGAAPENDGGSRLRYTELLPSARTEESDRRAGLA
jgi:hypothetical protein